MLTVSGTPIQTNRQPSAPATLSGVTRNGNQFQFTVTGTAGSNYVVQAATNLGLGSWTPVATNQSPFMFTDPNTGSSPQRFYRAIGQ